MTLHEGWDARYGATSFPFIDGSTLRSTGGAVLIPASAIRDMSLATPGSDATYLSRVERTVDDVIVSFSQGRTVIATCVINPDDTEWTQILDADGSPAGSMRIDQTSFAVLFSLAVGAYRFSESATTLVPWATFYRPSQGFKGLRLVDGTLIAGSIALIAGRGMQFDNDGMLSIIGDRELEVPETGLIPRSIRRLIIEDTDGNTYQVEPSKGRIRITTTNPTGKPSALTFKVRNDGYVGLEVSG